MSKSKEIKKPDSKQILAQLEQANIEEKAILKRNLQTFLGSIDNVFNINAKIIDTLKSQLNENVK